MAHAGVLCRCTAAHILIHAVVMTCLAAEKGRSLELSGKLVGAICRKSDTSSGGMTPSSSLVYAAAVAAAKPAIIRFGGYRNSHRCRG